jgi:serine/threonine protein kinase
MSPEQVKGMDLDRRSDIFGVGICLYELLTGERLFVGESDFSTLEKVRNVDIMPPSTYNRRIPEELEQIVLKALARNREDRYQTAMELHDDLQSFMYTSGNFFGRKDLSAYMRKAFAEELEKESARDAEYEAMGIPSSGGNENTGLHAFDNLEPVSTVSALHDMNAPSSNARAANVSQQSPQQVAASRRQPTLLGMPASRPQTSPPTQPIITRRSTPSVPPPSPRPESIPPSQPRTSSVPRTGGSSPRLEMDWDDEELSTQIYDKPEDVAAAIMTPQQAMTPAPTPAPRSIPQIGRAHV